MSMLDPSSNPAYSILIRRVEVFLDLLLGDLLDTDSVRELDRFVAIEVVVAIIVLEYMYHVASTDEVVDEVLDLLWQPEKRRRGVVLGTIDVRESVNARKKGLSLHRLKRLRILRDAARNLSPTT